MRITRIYYPHSIQIGQEIILTDDAANHVARVLRLKTGHPLIIFNENEGEFLATISQIEKKNVAVRIEHAQDNQVESPVKIHLAQVISRGEKMDFTIQKSVELGVSTVTPLISERCGVKLSQDRWDKKLEHWHKVMISACEQSGRTFIPKLNPVQELTSWLPNAKEDLKLIFHPEKTLSNPSLPKEKLNHSIVILIGPEGGFSENEILLAKQFQFHLMQLGPRVMRTETAGLAAIAAVQTQLGDFTLFS